MASIPVTSKPHILDIPDDEIQRGRKRRRSSVASPPMHISSNGSTNLRGRVRHRSPSQAQSSIQAIEKSPQSASHDRKSPGRKYQKKSLEVRMEKETQRRSQSPSRSRSLGNEGVRKCTPKPRRRQRTRTRSRSHGEEKGAGNGPTAIQVKTSAEDAIED